MLRRLAMVFPLFLIGSSLGCGDEKKETLDPPLKAGKPAPKPTPTTRAVYDGKSPITLQDADVVVTIRTAPFGLRIANAQGTVVLDTLDTVPDVAGDDVRAFGPLGATKRTHAILPVLIQGWDHVQATDSKWLHGSSVASLSATSTSASINLFDPASTSTTMHVDLELQGAELTVRETADDPKLTLFGQSFLLPSDEHQFGLGERFGTVDQRGTHYECWVEEGGVPAGENAPLGPSNPGPNGPGMTYLPVPFFVSTRGYGMWIEATYRTGFSFGAEDPHYARIYAEGPELLYHLFVHADPKDTIGDYTSLSGRAHLPAQWVFGPRRRTDHGVMVGGVSEIQAFRDQHVPTTMADDTTHFLPIGSEVGQEPALLAWTSMLHGLGFKAIAYYNPYVSVSSDATKDLVSYGRSHDDFVKMTDGKEFDTLVISAGYQNVATIDLTKQDAITWYQSILQRALDLGYDGWMLDFGEYIPPLAKMSDGRLGWEAHNAFPVDYDRAVAQYLRSVRGDDYMFFARAGYAGSQSFTPVVWSGDPAASYDPEKGLPAQVRAGINAGISGFPYWGSDISGYSCNVDPPPDKELYLRWAEFGALSPDMHDENACAQAPAGAPPKWTLWSDAETTQIYGQYASLHTRLLPYTYTAATEAAQTGVPIMRHPFLMHPTESDAYAVEFEYYFGPSLYVAPIVQRGATSRTLWLPPGVWFDWWTFAQTSGGKTFTRATPLAELPLWIRSGGVVAMLDPSIETLVPGPVNGVVTPDDVKDVLDVRAAVDPSNASASTTLYDGTVLEGLLGQGTIALPPGVTQAASDDDLATCSLCGKIDPLDGGGQRVRITGAATSDEVLVAGSLTLRHHTLAATRVRWEVLLGK